MTNYNQRLDEILDIFHNKMLALETITDPRDEPSDEIDRTFDDAKQALTSLIKELIEQAKPPYYSVEEPGHNARHDGIEQYETNLKGILK